MRVSKEEFQHIYTKNWNHTLERREHVRLPVPVSKRVAINVCRLATNIEYGTLSHLFSDGCSTVSNIIQLTCGTISCVLGPIYITMPTGLNLERVTAGIEERGGFPQCGGAIEGTHIPIIATKDYPISYYNRKGFYSVVMQAVYDHKFCQMICPLLSPNSKFRHILQKFFELFSPFGCYFSDDCHDISC